MLYKFKPKVTTHSPHGHHSQQTMQTSLEMSFFYSKDASLPCEYCAYQLGSILQLKHHINIHLRLKPITALSVSKSLASQPIFLCTAKYTPLLGFNCVLGQKKLSPKSLNTNHIATIHSKACSLVWKCFVFKRPLT